MAYATVASWARGGASRAETIAEGDAESARPARPRLGDEEDLGADDAEEDDEILGAQSTPSEVDLVDA